METAELSLSAYAACTWVLVWLAFWRCGPASARRRPYKAHPRLVLYSSALIAGMFAFYSVSLAGLMPIDLIRAAGSIPEFLAEILAFALVTAGTWLMVASRIALHGLTGREVIFSLNPEMVTSGVYSLMRHPMYVGMMLMVGGFFIAFPTWLGAASISVMILAIMMKARVERDAR